MTKPIGAWDLLHAFIPTIRLVAPCRAIPLPAWFVSGFGERASVPRLGFGLGRIWVSRVSLPLSFYYSCVYLQYIVIVILIYRYRYSLYSGKLGKAGA